MERFESEMQDTLAIIKDSWQQGDVVTAGFAYAQLWSLILYQESSEPIAEL